METKLRNFWGLKPPLSPSWLRPCSWLSKTSLEPTLIYDYGLAFVQNELEEEDIVYFNHEFLLSMGISIAKHRLEILKLARKETGGNLRPISRLLAAILKSKKSLSRYVRKWIQREESTALVVVSRHAYGSRWKGGLLKRNKKLVMIKQGRLILTNGSSNASRPPSVSNYRESPTIYDLKEDKLVDDEDNDGYWSSTVGTEEIRWDAMFQEI